MAVMLHESPHALWTSAFHYWMACRRQYLRAVDPGAQAEDPSKVEDHGSFTIEHFERS